MRYHNRKTYINHIFNFEYKSSSETESNLLIHKTLKKSQSPKHISEEISYMKLYNVLLLKNHNVNTNNKHSI